MKINLKQLNQQGFDHVLILVVFVVIFAGVGAYFLVSSRAATLTYYQVCDYTPSPQECMNDASGRTNSGTAVTEAVMNKKVSNQNFYINPLSDMCGHGRVTSTCPFTVGSGLNNRYINDGIVQFVYEGNFYSGILKCLGNGKNGGVEGALQTCNNVTGTGGGDGTVFILNSNGYTENRYWSDNNYTALKAYDDPSWLCIDGSVLNLDSGNSETHDNGACVWYGNN